MRPSELCARPPCLPSPRKFASSEIPRRGYATGVAQGAGWRIGYAGTHPSSDVTRLRGHRGTSLALLGDKAAGQSAGSIGPDAFMGFPLRFRRGQTSPGNDGDAVRRSDVDSRFSKTLWAVNTLSRIPRINITRDMYT